jgi:hypothetical protein
MFAEEHMINDHDLSLLLLSTSVFLLTTTVTFAALWLRARARRLTESSESPRIRVPELSAEVRHLINAVDAMAIEVERISEGQRFTTQILADRVLSDTPQQKRGPSTGRVITPH